jgi:predicted HTH transcriptional regulator
MDWVKLEIERVFDGPVDILAGSNETERTDKGKGRGNTEDDISSLQAEKQIVEMVRRRPCTALDIATTLKLAVENANEILQNLEDRGELIAKIHGGKKYFGISKD